MTVVLGLDTATRDAAVAVTRDGEVLREVAVSPGEGGRPRHSQVLLLEIERSVDAAGGWDAVERIAVGVGPGSFTGLRIGIATARALSQARRIPLAAVVTLAALARAISEHAGDDRPALPVLDARRGEAFAAVYGPDGSELQAPLVAPPRNLAALIAGLDPAPLAAGDGALRFAAELEAGGATVAPPQEPVHRVAARHVCGLGAAAPEAAAPSEVEPLYLRPPDAKRWLERDRDVRRG
ncbi:MAG TPA: tRNA (adenosine(37)-N6)-threonylcarbamoyltransferase complex dimerization subunit type 1 TsaB [Solirubrobacterales bacterium]|nr:tRNA (adenosine(37)-N6)-threonylcarbamoyltransferase complex dimerization subunit type 1 TsaB [Solirubrobacterales bacterium]